MPNEQLTINIRPPVSVYSTYRRLSYLPWYAIAEFVDNSSQNYHDHKHELDKVYKREGVGKFTIKIQYDSDRNTLQIYDNANGMDFSELQRAVILNSPPADISGRCEFGMGLKTAACWFGRKWTIETKRLGLEEKYSVTVDVEDISHESDETLVVDATKAKPSEHYTIITIEGLYKPIKGRTAGRIKDQLSSIYRADLQIGGIEIWWNGTQLSFPQPPFLEEMQSDGSKTVWRKEISFQVPWDVEHKVLPVNGWIGIRIPASQRDAGFVLMRRGRVVIGGPEKGYKPEEIFGQGNSYRSQRLIGELNLDNWPVTQAKDAFDWTGGLEDVFIDLLKEKCKDYMEKAEGHRERKPPAKEEMQEAASEIKKIFENPVFSSAIKTEISLPTPIPTPKQYTEDIKKIHSVSEGPLIFNLQLQNDQWIFKIYWQGQISDAHWMSVEYPSDTEIHIYLNSSHPFFEPYIDNLQMLELLQKFVLSLALAEKLARQSSKDNMIHAGDFRNYMNRVLRYASEIRGGSNDAANRN
ncbi:MAG: hypothetical protein MSIBF_06840 [Candidatus Altiarchaeales archaeon IMC4]|nr:MAG: hypothetical protein MSIBF_06840 [Candidatus Altiarchaeales archaeon IMC4]